MTKPIAIFFHGLFYLGDDLRENAVNIIREQMAALKSSGLLDIASEFIVGINGGEESRDIASLIIPSKAKIVLHGLQCKNECRTIRLIEEWIKGSSGESYVLYFHAKGSTHPPGDKLRTPWRECMMRHLVGSWWRCVADLDQGYEAAGCHWMKPPLIPATQFYFAGTFFWSKASFLRTLPSIMDRARIKDSGIDALESRFESEVWLGNGPRIPKVMDYCPRWSVGRSHSA